MPLELNNTKLENLAQKIDENLKYYNNFISKINPLVKYGAADMSEALIGISTLKTSVENILESKGVIVDRNKSLESYIGKLNIPAYDPAYEFLKNKWTLYPKNATYSRYLCTSASYNNKIYLFNGADSSNAYLNIVECYDISNDTWTTKGTAPSKRYSSTTSVIGNKAYVIGGQNTNGNSISVEEYNLDTETWTLKQNMITGRSRLSSASFNNKIYTFGGSSGLNKVEEYNVETNTWAAKQLMPTSRQYAAAVTIKNKIYVMGGNDSTGYLIKNLDEYDPLTDTWVSKQPMLSNGKSSFAASVNNNKIYVTGGYNVAPNGYSNSVEEYDPITNMWVSKTSMNSDRIGHVSEAVNNKLYAIGGTTGTGFANSVETFVF